MSLMSGGTALASLANGTLILRPHTDGVDIDLETKTVGKLGLDAGEINRLRAKTFSVGTSSTPNSSIRISTSLNLFILRNLVLTGEQIQLGGSAITTPESQIYNGRVILSASPTLTSATGNVTFSNTVDSELAAAPQGLVVRPSNSSETIFGGAIGATAPFSSLLVNRGTLVRINSSSISTTGLQSYSPSVILSADSVLTGSSVEFDGNVNGSTPGDQSLTINGDFKLGNGDGDAIGSTVPLEQLNVSGSSIFDTTAATTVTTLLGQSYGTSTTLTKSTTLASQSGGTIAFGGTIDGASALIVNTSGTTRFGNSLGGVTPLTSLVTDAPGFTEFGSGVTSGIIAVTGGITISDPLLLAADSVLTSSGGGNIFLNAVDGPNAFAVNTSGATVFTGQLGGIAALKSITTDSSGTVLFGVNSGLARSTGNQSYGDPLTLAANTVIYANQVSMLNAVNSDAVGPRALSLNLIDGATLNGIGATRALTKLDVNSTGGLLEFQGVVNTGEGGIDISNGCEVVLAGHLTATGAGPISIVSNRNIDVSSHITTSNGSIVLLANQQLVSSSGDFQGVRVSNATIQSTGSGLVTVRGRGGDSVSGGHNPASFLVRPLSMVAPQEC